MGAVTVNENMLLVFTHNTIRRAHVPHTHVLRAHNTSRCQDYDDDDDAVNALCAFNPGLIETMIWLCKVCRRRLPPRQLCVRISLDGCLRMARIYCIIIAYYCAMRARMILCCVVLLKLAADVCICERAAAYIRNVRSRRAFIKKLAH